MKKFRCIYMGTPRFAKEVLSHLLSCDFIEIVGVVTQPDRQKSKNKTIFSDVKKLALSQQLPILQPVKIKECINDLKLLNADVIITCAYGQFLPKSILDLTPLGVFNFHASLLPKYRGGAPMQWAIINGETETGMTLMKSILKMDAGDIYVQKSIQINLDDTLTSIENKLINVSKSIIDCDLLHVLNGTIQPQQQNENNVSFAYVIDSKMERIDFDKSLIQVYNHIRSLNNHPYAYATLLGKRIKFGHVALTNLKSNSKPGEIVDFSKEGLFIACKNQEVLCCRQLQIEGKGMSDVSSLVNGYKNNWIHQVFNDEN